MRQQPGPGEHVFACCGDTLTFSLELDAARRGAAWLRTNIGNACTARAEIIASFRYGGKRLYEDWHDFPMETADGRRFEARLPLLESGHFEAKSFFLEQGSEVPLWPQGPNTAINIHPAEYCSGNILYNAFVRQFGPNKSSRPRPDPAEQKCVETLDRAAWAVIPASGTFRDLAQELDFIIERLGCRILMLLPVHPVPTVYGRMGRFGSPYAALDFFDVAPELARFDTRATPLEQFQELADGVHARNARLFLDVAINHTGWASKLQLLHPDWFKHNPDGRIRSPGAWGVTWDDLAELDHSLHDVQTYCAEVFLEWCRRGVDGFRCDAGYMIPIRVWEFITASVRAEFPDTVFLLEGLGGKFEVTRELLNTGSLDWAYSELFQNISRREVESYLPIAWGVSRSDGLMMHFAETHDNNRLALTSPLYAKMRVALSALCSQNGAFAFANGVEWFATEKLDVHEAHSLNWGAQENQVAHIARLARLLRDHPVFFHGAEISLAHTSQGRALAVFRRHAPTGKKALALVNMDCESPATVSWSLEQTDFKASEARDLLSGKLVKISAAGATASVELAPGQAMFLSDDPRDVSLLSEGKSGKLWPSPDIEHQRLRAKALSLFRRGRGPVLPPEADPDAMARELARDPAAFCRKACEPFGEPRLAIWRWPADVRREAMILPGHNLLLISAFPFIARMDIGGKTLGRECSLAMESGGYFAVFSPREECFASERKGSLAMTVFEPGIDRPKRAEAPLLFLAADGGCVAQRRFSNSDIQGRRMICLGVNGRGGMSRAAPAFGEVYSKYDAMLAGNLSEEFPEDRRVMLTRCRAWLVYRGYSEDVDLMRLEDFTLAPDGAGEWRFRVSFGHKRTVVMLATLRMPDGVNAVSLVFTRLALGAREDALPDGEKVRLVVRPDLEDRSFHETTKALAGPEHKWPAAVRNEKRGFLFAPAPERGLAVKMNHGIFVSQPEWQYMARLPVEEERGLDFCTDLFSPGYFEANLAAGETVELSARIFTPAAQAEVSAPPERTPAAGAGVETPQFMPMLEALRGVLGHYLARRGRLKTVIAGFPWFLDWGRDTLIAARGLAAAGMIEEVKALLMQFARFEQNGTLPNMIRGEDASNRDTSDAPLWFFVVCRELRRELGPDKWLDEKQDGKCVRDALESIAENIMKGTPNGVRADLESGLVFSPAHFTWMDTNHPACTPRQGYPVEIQALWLDALRFLAEVSGAAKWERLAELGRDSLENLFWLPARGHFSDCLHAEPGTPAARAKPDDALRPNQLLALTLGQVRSGAMFRSALETSMELLVPGAIRSLADRPVEFPLPVHRDGKLLNNPLNPYLGRYEGDEDTRRKPAYHNGTAWAWLYPSFAEAWFMAYGRAGRSTALALLSASARLLNDGCLGHVPELLDGDFPHAQRGCDAQAWSVTELYRVWKLLADSGKGNKCKI